MRSRKYLALVLAALMSLSGVSGAFADEAPIYKLGDKPADFTVTMSDGQEFSLYGLLAEKEVVVLNFWATWCGPCRMEFPFLQDAYNELSDKVGIIALSIFDPDTNEVINDFKEELGLTTLPLGRDIGLAEQYNVPAYPTTFVIDRNGVICLEHTGMITSTRLFTNMIQMFLGDDYTESILLEEMPQLPFTEGADSEALGKAANAPGGTLEFISMADEDGFVPFFPSEEGDCVVASNPDMQGTVANLIMGAETKPGDVVVYEYLLKGLDFEDRLTLHVQETAANLHGIQTDGWTEAAARVPAEGADTFTFMFTKGMQGGYEADCRIRNVRLLTGDEAAAYVIPEIPGPKVLPGTEATLEFPETVVRVLMYNSDGTLMEGAEAIGYYMATTPVIDMKVRIGEDVNLQMATVNLTHDIMNSESLMLRNLPFDDEAYTFTVDMSKLEIGTSISILTDAITGESGQTAMLFPSGEGIKNYMLFAFSMALGNATEEQIDEVLGEDMGYYGLEDGTSVISMNDIIEAFKQQLKEEAEQEAAQAKSYVITFTDPDGKPLQGVMAQYCDDTTCTVQVSDENGVTRFEGKPYAYDIHVLMVPAGYQAVSENFTFPEEGGEIAITINPLAT